jgi:hypothetical protein
MGICGETAGQTTKRDVERPARLSQRQEVQQIVKGSWSCFKACWDQAAQTRTGKPRTHPAQPPAPPPPHWTLGPRRHLYKGQTLPARPGAVAGVDLMYIRDPFHHHRHHHHHRRRLSAVVAPSSPISAAAPAFILPHWSRLALSASASGSIGGGCTFRAWSYSVQWEDWSGLPQHVLPLECQC